MGFLEHLDELRRRILYSLYALVACCSSRSVLGTTLYDVLDDTTSRAYGGELIYTKPMAGFMFSLKICRPGRR